ncbi:MAG: CopG family ribbon-helix-helix protein [Candidatus Hodarchaeales archaeon]
MNKVKRIKKPVTISLNPALMEKIEKYMDSRGYSNRSKIVEDALKDYFAFQEQVDSETSFAIISVFFNHHDTKAVSSLLSVQHHSENVSIKYSSHLHLSHEFCLEIIVVEGMQSCIMDLEQKIRDIKGIDFVKTSILPPLSLVV